MEEFRNIYASANINRSVKARRLGWVGHVARMGEIRNAHETVIGKRGRIRSLGRPRCRWKIILESVFWE
jgi:hypothetical protein